MKEGLSMTFSSRHAVFCGTVLALAGCASPPMGPTVSVLPQQGKPFEIFQAEQAGCKQYAYDQVRGEAESANSTGLLEGVGGTILGAGLGAAIGGGQGAASERPAARLPAPPWGPAHPGMNKAAFNSNTTTPMRHAWQPRAIRCSNPLS